MKEELKQFDIDLDKIEENNNLFKCLNEAINKMKLYTLKDKFEVVLNNNLIEGKEKLSNFRTILGCRISYDNLDKNVSFIVREDNKLSYEELEQEIERLNNIINELEKYCNDEINEGNKALEKLSEIYNSSDTESYIKGQQAKCKHILNKLQELKGEDK